MPRKGGRAAYKEYYLRNREHIRKQQKEYRLATLTQRALHQRPPKTPEQARIIAEQNKRWRKDNPELFAVIRRVSKAKRKGIPGIHTPGDIKAIWTRQHHRCAVPECRRPIAEHGPHKYHVDHIRAIKNGGTNDPFNLQILCRFHNSQKHARDEYEWAQSHGRLFF